MTSADRSSEPPEETPPDGGSARPPLPDPTATGRLGLRLFLLSLGMFFAGGLAAFVASRVTRPTDGLEPVGVPGLLWLSTLLLLGSGIAVEVAAQRARRADLASLRRWLPTGLAVALLFVAAQAAGLARLLAAHELSLTSRAIIGLDGLAFALVLIHAVHVVGGMVLLAVLTGRSLAGALSLEHLPSVRHTATYWHFLEGVWLAMVATLYLFG